MSFWLISLNLKGMEGLFFGESRCCRKAVNFTWIWEHWGEEDVRLGGLRLPRGRLL